MSNSVANEATKQFFDVSNSILSKYTMDILNLCTVPIWRKAEKHVILGLYMQQLQQT